MKTLFLLFLFAILQIAYADYCINDSYLAINNTYMVCNGSQCNTISVNQEQYCSYGCVNSSCNISNFERFLIIFLILIFLIALINLLR